MKLFVLWFDCRFFPNANNLFSCYNRLACFVMHICVYEYSFCYFASNSNGEHLLLMSHRIAAISELVFWDKQLTHTDCFRLSGSLLLQCGKCFTSRRYENIKFSSTVASQHWIIRTKLFEKLRWIFDILFFILKSIPKENAYSVVWRVSEKTKVHRLPPGWCVHK